MKKMRTFAILFTLAMGLQSLGTAATVTVSGRQLLVNCAPFLVRGMNYSPVPTTLSNYEWATDLDVCNADFAQMSAMGVNTIRVYFNYSALFNTDGTVNSAMKANYDRALASAAAYGIYVIVNYFVPYGVDYTNAANVTSQETQFEAIINLFKNSATYPNILMWVFSNENNGNLGTMTTAQMYSFYQTAVSHAKTNADNTHPYAVALVQNNDVNTNYTTAPAVDIWALNIYQDTSATMSGVISAYTPPQPMVISEFGNDAFNNGTGAEDDADQSTFFTNVWPAIGSNLSALTASNKVLGGCVFEWNDEWWKYTNPSAHDGVGAGNAGNVLPDNFMNEEWFGLSTALAVGTVSPRTYRTAYTTLKNFWTAAPYNTTSPAACGASPTPTLTITPTSVPSYGAGCATVFDDFNNGAGGTDSFGGSWATVSDSLGSSSGVVFSAPGYTGYSMQFSYNIVAGGWTEAYAGLNAGANPTGAGTNTRNLSTYGRVTFWVIAKTAGNYWFKVASTQTYGGAGFVWWQAPFNATTSWTQVSLNLDTTAFTNPGANTGTLPQNLSAATQFVIQPQSTGSSILWVDDINLVNATCLVTNTPTNSPTKTFTPTATNTNSPTFTPTRTFTATSSPTPTMTNSFTFTATSTNSFTPSFTATSSPTFTSTSTSTATFTRTFTSTFTNTAVPPTNTFTPSFTSTATASSTPTATFTFTRTNTPTNTVTSTSTPSMTSTTTASNTPTFTFTHSPTASFTATSSPTSTSTGQPTATFTSSFTQTNTPINTDTMTNTSTPTPTSTATASFTATASLTSTATSTASFTATRTNTPMNTVTPTNTLTSTNSFTATASPTSTSTGQPTATFTATATATFTNSFTATSTSTGTPSFTRTSTSTFTSTSTATRTLTSATTLTNTFTNTSTATATWSSTATATNTSSPSKTFTPTPTQTATSTSTPSFTPVPTRTLTPRPTPTLSGKPTPVIFPNPVSGPGPVHLRLPITGPSDVQVVVFTSAFRNVNSFEAANLLPAVDITIPLDDRWGTPLANGLYYVVATAQGKTWIVKLLVLR